MKKLGLSVLFLLMLVPLVRAQKCDCTITPFKPTPPCFDVCTLSLLARANLIDLHFAFGLKEETAKKLLAWQKGHQPTSLVDYETAHVLTEAEIDKLKKRVDSFTPPQLEYLSKPDSERQLFAIKEIKEIFKSSEDEN